MARSKSSTTRSAKDILRAAAAKVAAVKDGKTKAAAKSERSSRATARTSATPGRQGAARAKGSTSAATTAKSRSKAAKSASAGRKASEKMVSGAGKTSRTRSAAPPKTESRAGGVAAAAAKKGTRQAPQVAKRASAAAKMSEVGGDQVRALASAKPAAEAPRRGGAGAVAVARAVARPAPVASPPAPPIAAVTPARVELPDGYRPSADEPYMNPMQLEYFRRKLLKWREELVEESRQTLDHLRSEVRDVGDEAERATRESENALELRTRDRYRKLIAKIDAALRRIDDGTYGYCDETGEPIGLERLEARPIATLSLDAQERRELLQRQLGE